MIVSLYCKYNTFMSYLYFITKVIILKILIGINTLYQYINNIHLVHLNYLIIFVHIYINYESREFKLVFHLVSEIIYNIGTL